MSKVPETLLVISPPTELRFRGPFTDVVISELHLKNPTENKICFKIKTTAPRRYCVRPNSGVLGAGEDITVNVMLQPFEYDPQEKNKHKFMVQAMTAPPGEFDQEAVWKDKAAGALMESKLKCVFEMPASAAVPASASPPQPQERTSAKLSPKPMSQASAPKPAAAATSRDTDDVKRLQQEVSSLQQKLTVLEKEKEDGLRRRNVGSEGLRASNQQPVITETKVDSSMPIVYMILALVLGFILGKFILQ
ncbi:vesicle-associated membrane protein-associated protein A-like [Antedon mediterranea]|uniref:vesicle-associated membrane protein-associated protein A-like n=1 Tax=Antedon mediterranea TaxID=105859 RepID=UPI003AF584E9